MNCPNGHKLFRQEDGTFPDSCPECPPPQSPQGRQGLPPVYCDLNGVDSNTYGVMGHWIACARRAKWPKAEIDRVIKEAKAGDYDHLLLTIMDNCTDPSEGGSDDDSDE